MTVLPGTLAPRRSENMISSSWQKAGCDNARKPSLDLFADAFDSTHHSVSIILCCLNQEQLPVLSEIKSVIAQNDQKNIGNYGKPTVTCSILVGGTVHTCMQEYAVTPTTISVPTKCSSQFRESSHL